MVPTVGSLVTRKLMQRYWRFKRPHTLGAQGLVLDVADRVLLVRHSYRPGWHFPGGGVEQNETAEEALARELVEEAGVHLTGRPELLGIYANFAAFPNDHILLYLCRAWTQPVPPVPNREIVAHGWFAMDSLPEELVPGARRRLTELSSGQPRDHRW